MARESVRQLLLRVLFDEEFHQLIITEPEQALIGYDLTDQEREELMHPGNSFYALLNPVGLVPSRNDVINRGIFEPPPVTTTTTNTVTITITITTNTTTITVNTVNIVTNSAITTTTTTSSVFNPYNFLVNDALQILGEKVLEANDKERFTRIVQLLQIMSGEKR